MSVSFACVPLLGRSQRCVADLKSGNPTFFISECKSSKIVTVRRHSILRRSSVAELVSTILTIVESNTGWSYFIRGLPCSFLLNDLSNDAASLFSSQTLHMPSFSFKRRSVCRFASLWYLWESKKKSSNFDSQIIICTLLLVNFPSLSPSRLASSK